MGYIRILRHRILLTPPTPARSSLASWPHPRLKIDSPSKRVPTSTCGTSPSSVREACSSPPAREACSCHGRAAEVSMRDRLLRAMSPRRRGPRCNTTRRLEDFREEGDRRRHPIREAGVKPFQTYRPSRAHCCARAAPRGSPCREMVVGTSMRGSFPKRFLPKKMYSGKTYLSGTVPP